MRVTSWHAQQGMESKLGGAAVPPCPAATGEPNFAGCVAGTGRRRRSRSLYLTIATQLG